MRAGLRNHRTFASANARSPPGIETLYGRPAKDGDIRNRVRVRESSQPGWNGTGSILEEALASPHRSVPTVVGTARRHRGHRSRHSRATGGSGGARGEVYHGAVDGLAVMGPAPALFSDAPRRRPLGASRPSPPRVGIPWNPIGARPANYEHHVCSRAPRFGASCRGGLRGGKSYPATCSMR